MEFENIITDNLNKDMILDIKKMPKEQALDLLMKTMSHDKRISDFAQFKQSVISREMLMSTGIGNGIAIPHARLDTFEGIMIGLIRCREGIPYESFDDAPVYFIFMIASGRSYDKVYLKLLSALTTKLRDDDLIKKLLAAETPADIFELLKKE